MNKPFRFRVADENTPDQRLVFSSEGEPDVEYPIADMAIPKEQEARFRALYAHLVSVGAIEDFSPTYKPR